MEYSHPERRPGQTPGKMKVAEGKLIQKEIPKISSIRALRQRAERRAEQRRSRESGIAPAKEPRAVVLELQARRKELEDRVGQLTTEFDAFSYSVSHDLREPLRHIEGFTRAIIEDHAGRLDATGRDYCRRIHEAAFRMSHLLDAMLRLSRLSSWQLNHATVNLSALAASIVRRLRHETPGRKVKCVIARGITVRGDSEILRIVLENLIDNAWKFTKKRRSPKIEFGTTTRKGSTVYFVRDDGVGFDPAYADKLFQPSHRLHSRVSYPGIGFGLATAKRLIERHGGKIWAEGGIDKGATFFFTLPAAEQKT